MTAARRVEEALLALSAAAAEQAVKPLTQLPPAGAGAAARELPADAVFDLLAPLLLESPSGTSNAELRRMLHELEQDEPPAHVCGHIFREGEAVYGCEDCGVDPTCVLCGDCFHKSHHARRPPRPPHPPRGLTAQRR